MAFNLREPERAEGPRSGLLCEYYENYLVEFCSQCIGSKGMAWALDKGLLNRLPSFRTSPTHSKKMILKICNRCPHVGAGGLTSGGMPEEEQFLASLGNDKK